MAIEVFTADEYRSAAFNKTSLAIFGPYGVGKTSLLKGLPPAHTVCIDIEAGLNSVRWWDGLRLKIGNFEDFQDLVALLAGPSLAAGPEQWFSVPHVEHARRVYAGTRAEEAAHRPVIFVDSITELTRLAMSYAQQQPEAFSERSNKPDLRGAYGLLAREVIRALKHLQHARGKTVIFAGVLEKVVDDFGRVNWLPQMEGSKAGRRAPRHRRSGLHDALLQPRRKRDLGFRRDGQRAAACLPIRQSMGAAGERPFRKPDVD